MPVDSAWLEQAAAIVGPAAVLQDDGDVVAYGRDEYALDTHVQAPRAVIKPGTEQQVADVVRLCAASGVPVTARGGGTGLAAACVPAPDGIVLSLERLNHVVEANPADGTITVQAGVTLKQLNEEAKKLGLFFPPHPGDESAMVGGMIATNAGGARAVKYGTIKHFVLGLQVVLADGRLIELGGRFLKSSMGYNLLGLLIGAEGTLGIITRATLALRPPPGALLTLLAPFADVPAAIAAVPAILASGVVPLALEFVEHTAIRCAERLVNRRWPTDKGAASLIVMLDGPGEAEVTGQAEAIAAVLEQNACLDVLLADQEARQNQILDIRSMVYEALRPGTAELFDVCVPRSQIAPHVAFVHALAAEHGVPLPTYGHAADGNVHTNFMRRSLAADGTIGEEIPAWPERHRQVRQAIFDDVIRRAGVISGEHGIGLAKRDYLERNLGRPALELMRAVKHALDPRGILNPGKIFAP